MTQHASGLELSLLTVNTNGIRSARKAGKLLAYQGAVGRVDAVLVQECKLQRQCQLEARLREGAGAGTPWAGEVAFNPGTAHSCGTAILARTSRTSALVHRSNITTVAGGRLVGWDWDVGHHRLRVVSVYAPTDPQEREQFFTDMSSYLMTTDRLLLVGGDLNCVLEPGEQAAHSAARLRGAQQLRALMAAKDLDDPWRVHGDGTAGFTHPATPKPASAARLDRWLVSKDILSWITGVERHAGAPSDHHGVCLRLRLPDLPPLGKPGWRFPTYLLYHPTLKPQLEAAVQQYVAAAAQSAQPAATPQEQWEATKAFLQTTADHLHREHSKQQREAVHSAKAAAEAALRTRDRAPASAAAQQVAEATAASARQAVAKAHAAKTGAQAAWFQHQGERGTRWFHRLAKRTKPPEPIAALKVPGAPEPVPLAGHDVTSIITAAAHATYSSDSPTGLFRKGVVEASAQDTLLQHLQRTLSPELRDSVDAVASDGELRDIELLSALGQSANGKAGGTDGIPYEVYRVLWQHVEPRLTAAANAAYRAAQAAEGQPDEAEQLVAALPRSWREGVITLIYKGKDLPKAELTSYRPITLLNADYKLVAKALSNRLQPGLAELIDLLQTAFLAGRDSRDNVLYHQSLMEWLESSGQPGALLMLDIEKAYDRVDRQWVTKVAGAMGFGTRTHAWLKLLMAEGEASVLVNGHRSNAFPVRNGLHQGSTLSPVLWVLQFEPFTAYLHHLRTAGVLRTPVLPDGSAAPPASHHADDTNLLMLDADVDGPPLMAAVDLYCRASNAKINASKSKGLTLGTHRAIDGVHAGTGARFAPADSREPPRHLGVPMSTDLELAAALAYTARIKRVRQLGSQWREHELSLVGREYIAKQVLGNSLCYHLAYVPPTPQQMEALHKAIDGFTAWSHLPEDVTLVSHGHAQPLPTTSVSVLPKVKGGIGHFDLASFADALMAKTISHLALPGTRKWQVLLRGQLARAAPAGTSGWSWVYGTCPIPDTLSPRLQAVVRAYRNTQPTRFVFRPGVDDARAVLAEPLFYNARLRDPATDSPFPAPAGGLPPGFPLTVAQLRAASPNVQGLPLLQAMAAAMPSDWKAMLPPDPLTAPQPAPGPWQASPDGQWVVGAAGQVLRVDPTGRLLTAPAALQVPAHSHAWPAACVIPCRKPKGRWTLEERMAYRAAPAKDKAAAWPVEPHLLGPWEGLACYPLAHGHGTLPLTHFEVRETRVRLTGLRAAAKLGATNVPVRPAAWPDAPSQAQMAGEGAAAPSSALARAEVEWKAELARANHPPPRPPGWMAPQGSQARQESAARRDARAANRAAAADMGSALVGEQARAGTAAAAAAEHPDDGDDLPPGEEAGPPAEGTSGPAGEQGSAAGPSNPMGAGLGGAAPGALVQQGSAAEGEAPVAAEEEGGQQGGQPQPQQAWSRLWDCPAGNRAKVLGWRLAHGRLPTGLYFAAKRGLSRAHGGDRHLCQHSTCLQQRPPQRRPLDSLSHVFLACPSFAPARQWFAGLWSAVSGGPPPPVDNAALMLGDMPDAWQHHPAPTDNAEGGGKVRLWNAVRLTFLFALWCAHQDPEPGARTARAVVTHTIEELQRLMWAQFRVAAASEEDINALPTSLLTADLKPGSMELFEECWALNDSLCTVDKGANGRATLRMRLSRLHPMPVMGAAEHGEGGGSDSDATA